MGSEIGGTVPKASSFAQALGALKRRGSNVLVVGTGATAAHEGACSRLLGDANDEPRYRLLVRTEGPRCTNHCSHAVDTADVTTRVISRADDPERGPNEAVSPDVRIVGTDLLSQLGMVVIEQITAFEDDADGLEPSELRVCVDSLVPLLAQHGPENVFRMLHVTTSRVRQVSGMGHYHLPIEPDHDVVNLLEPLFDATVEVRSREGTPEQRWHLRDQRTSSEWVSL